MRTLAVLTFSPWPARSGVEKRLAAAVEALRAVGDVTVALVIPPHEVVEMPTDVEVVRIDRSSQRARSLLHIAVGGARLRPITAGFYVRQGARQQLQSLVGRLQPRATFTHGLGGAALVDGLVPRSATILDADTIDPQSYRTTAEGLRGAERWQWQLDVPLISRWHRRNLDQFARVFVASTQDAVALRGLAPDADIGVVPNGIDVVTEPRADPGSGVVVFVGSRTYPPNRTGLEWLATEVFRDGPPRGVRELRVIGHGPAPTTHPFVALGFVDDLQAQWRDAIALVVPIRSGGGTRVKALEAMAAGVPVVSTRFGVGGLGVTPEHHYVAAESPTEWRAALERVAADEALRARLSRNARAHVEASFRWETCTRPIQEAVRQLS